QRPVASDQQQILTVAQTTHAKHEHVRKHLLIRRQHRSQTLRRKLVNLHPLHPNSIITQPRPPELKKLLREQVRDARHPRMTRLTHDHVVTIRRHTQKRSRIVDDQRRAWIVERSVVHMIEKLRTRNRPWLEL